MAIKTSLRRSLPEVAEALGKFASPQGWQDQITGSTIMMNQDGSGSSASSGLITGFDERSSSMQTVLRRISSVSSPENPQIT